MHKIIEKNSAYSMFMDMGIGDFCEVVSSQSVLDTKSVVIHTGDIFIKTGDDLTWVCISTNHTEDSADAGTWVGTVFDFSEDEFADIRVKIFEPKEIIFNI